VYQDTWQTQSGATIGTCPFGSPLSGKDFGIIDAAAAFDVYATGQSKIGVRPVVISTHATKTFSTGEGGLVFSADKKFIQKVREIINHGLTLDREVPVAGINGKLSEYHAAVGLAELEGWKEKRQRWLETKAMYIETFEELAHTTPLSSLSWVGSTFCIRLVGKDVREIIPKLIEQGIASRQVWGRGVHRYDAYKNCDHGGLPVTEKLADECLFLPFSIDSTRADARYIHECVRKLICA
jgi:dTDP-4-amino-4,6-dideoxygalactose transaminase